MVPRARPLIPTIPAEEVGGTPFSYIYYFELLILLIERCVALHSFVAEKACDLSFEKVFFFCFLPFLLFTLTHLVTKKANLYLCVCLLVCKYLYLCVMS